MARAKRKKARAVDTKQMNEARESGESDREDKIFLKTKRPLYTAVIYAGEGLLVRSQLLTREKLKCGKTKEL
jgi:hypothetical protein